MDLARLGAVVRCAAAMAIAALALGPGVAHADQLVHTHTSAACAGTSAQDWRIGYRLYFSDDAGHSTTRDAIAGVDNAADRFADAVATDSACALRLTVDVFDMGDTPFPSANAAAGTFTPPATTPRSARWAATTLPSAGTRETAPRPTRA